MLQDAQGIVTGELLCKVAGEELLLVTWAEDRNRIEITRKRRSRQAFEGRFGPENARSPRERRIGTTEGAEQAFADWRRHIPPQPVLHLVEVVAAISGEHLITAVSAERNGDMPPGDFRDVVGGDRRGVRERFVVVPDKLIDNVQRVGSHDLFVVLGPEERGNFTGVSGFVVVTIVEANRT